jgi:signal peptidase I
MDILNKDKLKQVLEKWKGHPSITDLMDRFGKLQTYTKKKFKKKPKYDLIELHDIDVKEDPVRPELTLEFRQKNGRKIYGLKDEEGDIAAIMCFAFTHNVPKTVEELDALSYDAWMQSTHRAGIQGDIAIAYTVWAKKRGGGKAIVNEVYKMIKESHHLNRLVTLSPLTDMARKFHIRNGAKELQVNEESQNFEYDITLEDWEKALDKAKRFFKIK